MSEITNGFPQGSNISVKWCHANSTVCSSPILPGNSDSSAPSIDAGLIIGAFGQNDTPTDSYLKILSIHPKDHDINVLYKTIPKVWVLSLEGVADRCSTHVNVEIGP